MLPRTISPLCRQLAARAHCVSSIFCPTRSWSTRVGRLLGRIWPRTHQLGVLAAPAARPRRAPARRRSRSEKERSASDAPAAEQALQVAELFGLELGVGLRQLGRGGHRYPPSLRCRRAAHGDVVRHPAPVGLQGRRRPHPGRRAAAARSATCSWRWASEAVVNGTPRAANRSRSGSAGYCSPTGLRQPAEESSAAMPDDAAASAMRSHHSAGASGT